jgi:Protein of unknown function (DUF2726)
MQPMNTIAMIVAAILVLAIIFWLRKKAGPAAATEDNFSPADFRLCLTRPLTKNELKVLRLLQSSLPECLLLPQVSLSRFVQVHENRSYHTWFHKVGRRCVDILICTSAGDVLGVVDLEDGASRRGDGAARAASVGTARKIETLRLAKVPVWRFDPSNLPSHGELRDLVLEQWQASQLRPPSGAPASQWPQTELAPRREGLEVTEAELAESDSQWQAQPWPTPDERPSDFLDQLDVAASRRSDLR